MLRLISSLSRQQHNLIVVKGQHLQKVSALFTAQKEEHEEEVEEGDVPEPKVQLKETKERDPTNIEGAPHEQRQYKKREYPQQTGRVLRTSQEPTEEHEPMSFGVNREEATEYFTKQLQKLDKHMPLNVFSCLNLTEQQEKAMRYLLQDDEQRNIRGKMVSLFKRVLETGVNEEIVKSVEDLTQNAFYKEQYYFITERDFKTLIFTKEFQRIVPLFFNKRFFAANPTFLTQFEVIQIFKRCRSSPEYYPLMELLRYHRNFFVKNVNVHQKFTSADKEVVQQFVFDIRAETHDNLNYPLTFFIAHNLVRLNLSVIKDIK